MKAKIQRSMLLVLFVTILIFYGLLTLVMYQKNLTLLKEEVNQEARYIRTAVDISGPAYLKEMDGVDIKTRVTRISTEGKVLYDSGNDAETLENHSKRPEVKEALANGIGEDPAHADDRNVRIRQKPLTQSQVCKNFKQRILARRNHKI